MKHIIIVLTMLLLAGCRTQEQVMVTPEATAVSTPTLTITHTATAVPTPTTITETPTRQSTQTPRPTPTPFPEMTGEYGYGSDSDYWFMWPIPFGWPELTDQWPPPSDKTVLWRVWSDQAEAAALLSDKTASFPDGLMVLTLHVETDAEPAGTETTSLFGQTRWVDERHGTAAAPFDLRLQAAAWREPYLYTFALNCLSPTGADNNVQEAFNAYCRYVWDYHVFSFSLCAMPIEPTSGPFTWQRITSKYYQYAFELPADWYDDSGPTGDSRTYFSHRVHQQPHGQCPIPEGVMKVEFSADNFPGTEALAAYTAVSPIAGRRAWIKSWGDGEGGTFASDTKELIILGPEHSYRLFLYCSPQWTDDCEQVFTHIVESFEIVR